MIVLFKHSLLILLLIVLIPIKGFCYSAQSAVVMEQGTRKVLFESNAYEQLGMASTTKIMTAIVTLENTELHEVVKIGKNAVGVEGSSMWLEVGEAITVENLLYGLMLNSGNDAAVALAEYVGGTVENFCSMMNEKAKAIGASQTHFVNPNGLPEEGHYTTAYDLGLIACYALENEWFCKIVSTRERNIPWPGREYDKKLVNHNKMLRMYEGCDGVKTGFTKSTGRALVSSATRDGMQVVAVTLNAPDDWNDHKLLLDNAFGSYQTVEVIPKKGFVKELPVIGGTEETVGIYTEDKLSFVCKQNQHPDYRLEVEVPKSLKAPFTKGQKVGTVRVLIGNEQMSQGDLYVGASVQEDKRKQFFLFLLQEIEVLLMGD